MSRPTDWSPVQMSSDPTPGDATAVAALARRYHDTAQAISDQAARLKSLQSGTSGQWVGKSGDVFRQHAGDLADRITKAHSRYQAAGDALATFARDMTGHQNDADRALAKAQSAQSTMQSNAPGPPRAPDAPPLTPAEATAEHKRSTAYDTASGDLTSAISAAQGAKTAYDNLASRVANQLHGAIQHDGVHDSWWDKAAGWVESAVKIIGIVITVLAVIALVIVTFGAAVPFLITAAIIGLSALSLVADIALAATHKGSWTAVVFDAIGLVTAGFGAGAGRIAEGAQVIGARAMAGQAGRAAFRSHGLPGVLYSVVSRSTTARSVMELLPRGSRVIGEADRAASTARGSIMSLKGVTTPLRTMLAGDGELAKAASLANQVNEAAPGILRVGARARALQGAAYTSGATNSVLIARGTYQGYHDFVVEPRREAAAEQEISRISARYDRPTIHVP